MSKYEFLITPQSDFRFYNLQYRLKKKFNLFNQWKDVPNPCRLYPGEFVGVIFKNYESAKKEAEYYINNPDKFDLKLKRTFEEAEKLYQDNLKWIESRNKSSIIK